MSAVETLRETAKALRERAEAAPGGPWRYAEHGYYHTGPTEVRVMSSVRPEPMLVGEYDSYSGHAAIYAAMMHPGVALALADWLDDLASGWPWDDDGTCVWDDGTPMRLEESPDAHALAVAEAILGGAQ